jgi:hypothetical protein
LNIDDVKQVEEVKGTMNVVHSMFDKQRQLFEKYFSIETRNGFYKPEVGFVCSQPGPKLPKVQTSNSTKRPHIDDSKFQHWVKDMLWRATEEIAEAMEVFPDLTGDYIKRWDEDASLRHFFEELADALHFLIEVSLVVGVDQLGLATTWDRVTCQIERYPGEEEIRDKVLDVIVGFGLVGNTLKNKPWKSSHMPTDELKFKRRLDEAWIKFFELWARLGMQSHDVYALYFKKNAVNQFRQDSNY